MSWKEEIQLRDLDGSQAIEVLCRKCRHAHYERVADLLEAAAEGAEAEAEEAEEAAGAAKPMTPFTYLDEVEALLACRRWGCQGPVTISLADNAETSAFVGGLP